MGIGGSGMAAVAMIAKNNGFEVSGCDLQDSTPYLQRLKKVGVKIYQGHDASHLKNADILTVSPAIFYSNRNHEEVEVGKKKNLMTWQEFFGKYIQKNKKVIGVAGTHGKSTTTAMLGQVLEGCGVDPTVELGANVQKWSGNFRIGNSNLIAIEADEFYSNFLNYRPEIAIINNVEFDHPDYFESYNHVLKTFVKFVGNLRSGNTLILNQDSLGVKDLYNMLDKKVKNSLGIVGYTIEAKPLFELENSYRAEKLTFFNSSTGFVVTKANSSLYKKFKLSVPGKYNISNALGVIAAAKIMNLDMTKVRKSLEGFKGIGRRMELVGKRNGVLIYDDYAHHPTEIKATLSGLRQKYPQKKVLCIVEPHMYSRTKKLLNDYKNAFINADQVIVAPIFKSRDTHTFGMSNSSIVKKAGHKNIKAVNSFDEILETVKKLNNELGVIVVMGAGDSYKLAREIIDIT